MSAMLKPVNELGHRELFAHGFALINPMRVAPGRWQDLPAIPLRAPAFQAQPHLVPRLLPLAALDDIARSELLERNDLQYRDTGQPMFCALLASSADPRTLAAALGERMLASDPAGQAVWLRFHDPRVFSALAWWLGPEQRQWLLGPVRMWTWPEPRDRCWHRLGQPDAPGPGIRKLTLGRDQWDRLQRQPLVNQCLRQLAGHRPDSGPLRALVERIDAHLCRAMASGIADEAGLCRYAVRAEHQEHPGIKEPA